MKNPQLPSATIRPMTALAMAVVYGGRYSNEDTFTADYTRLCNQARVVGWEVFEGKSLAPGTVRWPEVLGKMTERETGPARLAILHALYAELAL